MIQQKDGGVSANAIKGGMAKGELPRIAADDIPGGG